MDFELITDKKLSGDQPKAVKELNLALKKDNDLILLGATGTGKTFTIANVIQDYNKPTLVLVHNKSLANQLYIELKTMFPNNRVEYFISNFDFYQPEAYVPASNTYIEKQSVQNMILEMMRMSALSALTSRKDVIVVASVAAIYGTRSPQDFIKAHTEIIRGDEIERDELLKSLVELGYRRSLEAKPGSLVVKGDIIEIFPSWTDEYNLRIELYGNEIEEIVTINQLTKEIMKHHKQFIIFPADPYVSRPQEIEEMVPKILKELKKSLKKFQNEGKKLEAQRLEQRINFDIEQLKETGLTSGIENYAIYFDKGRKTNEPAYSLIDYFPKDFLIIIDESHMTIPQLNAMYKGDRSRKETLVKYGFRLPSALDNRPLKFSEFEKKMNKVIYVSATPGNYELEKTKTPIIEQINRPTGLVDPEIEIRNADTQIDNLQKEIEIRKAKNERVLITTISRKLSEDIAHYYKNEGLSVVYLHYDLKPLERDEILRKLRLGVYDAVVGINLLREGLDLPEVSLIAIFDADIEGFLRNKRSLLQMIGRVSRNINGKAIFYANTITQSMKNTIKETERRKKIQLAFNKKNNIIPTQISKPIPEPLVEEIEQEHNIKLSKLKLPEKIKLLEKDMKKSAREYNFEKAIKLRDMILELEKKHGKQIHKSYQRKRK